MTRRTWPFAAALAAAFMLATVSVSGVAAGGSEHKEGRGDLKTAREATERFRDLGRATAAGYALLPAPAPLHECISSFDGTGAMGFHYINFDLLNTSAGPLTDTTLDPARPEALVYAPDRHGRLKLVALEYVVFVDAWLGEHPGTTPMLFGQMFMRTESPNRYGIPAFFALHAWLWKHNPSGMFAPFNPRVSCGGSARATAARTVSQVNSAQRWQCSMADRRPASG